MFDVKEEEDEFVSDPSKLLTKLACQGPDAPKEVNTFGLALR